jgi:hypothetical protein
VNVRINGNSVATVSCQLGVATGGPTLTPGPDLPLPWHVDTVDSAGDLLLSVAENGTGGPRAIVIRGHEAVELPSEDASGGAVPAGTCAP